MTRTLRGQTAIVGIGETTYYRHGQSPDAEFKLALQAVIAACKDAGISPHNIDGFASYGNDRSEAACAARSGHRGRAGQPRGTVHEHDAMGGPDRGTAAGYRSVRRRVTQ